MSGSCVDEMKAELLISDGSLSASSARTSEPRTLVRPPKKKSMSRTPCRRVREPRRPRAQTRVHLRKSALALFHGRWPRSSRSTRGHGRQHPRRRAQDRVARAHSGGGAGVMWVPYPAPHKTRRQRVVIIGGEHDRRAAQSPDALEPHERVVVCATGGPAQRVRETAGGHARRCRLARMRSRRRRRTLKQVRLCAEEDVVVPPFAPRCVLDHGVHHPLDLQWTIGGQPQQCLQALPAR
eukprot:1406606-Pleurochrysis_carterae.AAC.2